MENKLFYRIHKEDGTGLWYNLDGTFSGIIQNLNLSCSNLDMSFNEKYVGWLSACDSLDELFMWFSVKDLSKLYELGFKIFTYESTSYKKESGHWLINKNESKIVPNTLDNSILVVANITSGKYKKETYNHYTYKRHNERVFEVDFFVKNRNDILDKDSDSVYRIFNCIHNIIMFNDGNISYLKHSIISMFKYKGETYNLPLEDLYLLDNIVTVLFKHGDISLNIPLCDILGNDFEILENVIEDNTIPSVNIHNNSTFFYDLYLSQKNENDEDISKLSFGEQYGEQYKFMDSDYSQFELLSLYGDVYIYDKLIEKIIAILNDNRYYSPYDVSFLDIQYTSPNNYFDTLNRNIKIRNDVRIPLYDKIDDFSIFINKEKNIVEFFNNYGKDIYINYNNEMVLIKMLAHDKKTNMIDCSLPNGEILTLPTFYKYYHKKIELY